MKEVVLYRTEDGLWAAETARLPGYTAYGMTEEETLKRIREAVSMYFPCGECGDTEGGR